MWQSWMGWKMSLCKTPMTPCLICYFIVILFYIETKWLLMRNLTTVLPLKSKLPAKFQRFNAIGGSIKMLKSSPISKKIQLKWKVVQHFTKPKQQSALRKLFRLPATHPHQVKPYYVFGTKFFSRRYIEIHRNLLSKCIKKVVLGRQKRKCFFWCSANFFSDKKQKHVCWKICKVRKETYF